MLLTLVTLIKLSVLSRLTTYPKLALEGQSEQCFKQPTVYEKITILEFYSQTFYVLSRRAGTTASC